MAGIGLIFTTDYEIFGNGTGCVEKCMLEPTEKMAAILEQVGAPLTIFFDVCEYWAFEKEFEKGKLKKDWAGMIRNQLQDMVQRGHDVQLHFHPQWLEYSFDGENWQLNYDLWRIGKLKYEDDKHPERGLKNLFARGKSTLEEMIQQVKPDYKCEVFRAGAWSIQPEGEVLKAMIENGFKIDSTVAPGLHFDDGLTYYDFTGVPKNKGFYRISKTIGEEASEGALQEIPIWTSEIPLWHRIRFLSNKLFRNTPMRPEGCKGEPMASSKKSKIEKIRELLGQSTVMFNFSDGVSFEEMRFHTLKALEKANERQEFLPLVCISHPKSFGNHSDLQKYIAWVSKKAEISFSKYQHFLKD